MSNIVLAQNNMDVMTLGGMLAKSGYFQDARDAAQACVKVLAGQELGFGPIASMTGVNIIKGKVSLSANLMASAVKNSKRYNYRVKEMSDKVVTIEFLERDGDKWVPIGISTFTADDANKAGTQNMNKFPRNMLFARALSNGVRWYCPEVTNGNQVYTPDELGAVVDENGDMIGNRAYVKSEVEEPETYPNNPVDNFISMSAEKSDAELLKTQFSTLLKSFYECGSLDELSSIVTSVQKSHIGEPYLTDLRKAAAEAANRIKAAKKNGTGGNSNGYNVFKDPQLLELFKMTHDTLKGKEFTINEDIGGEVLSRKLDIYTTSLDQCGFKSSTEFKSRDDAMAVLNRVRLYLTDLDKADEVKLDKFIGDFVSMMQVASF